MTGERRSRIGRRLESALRSIIDVEEYTGVTELSRILGGVRLIIADVGSAGGPEDRWKPYLSLCSFYTFDPDEGSTRLNRSPGDAHFSIGLWSKSVTRELRVTRFPAASSVLQLNEELLNQFLNAPCHAVVATQEVQLETLTKALSGYPLPDFLKVDAEGADLEILRGADTAMRNCLGVQVEVSFVERHRGGSFFSDTDAFLRAWGFALHGLRREHWIRSNAVIGPRSRPQIIWADAVYFIEEDSYVERLRSVPPELRPVTFAKMITVLLAYRAHDYAIALTRHAARAGLIDADTETALDSLVRKAATGGGLYLWRSALAVGVSLLIVIVSLPFASVRRRAIDIFRRRLRRITTAVDQELARGGPYDACLTDPD